MASVAKPLDWSCEGDGEERDGESNVKNGKKYGSAKDVRAGWLPAWLAWLVAWLAHGGVRSDRPSRQWSGTRSRPSRPMVCFQYVTVTLLLPPKLNLSDRSDAGCTMHARHRKQPAASNVFIAIRGFTGITALRSLQRTSSCSTVIWMDVHRLRYCMTRPKDA